ncbi:MAG: hypothetical protein IT320_27980 [Anaerolineae bacterium]|nr:hypothetical protein [Anaerolineae bacterium]
MAYLDQIRQRVIFPALVLLLSAACSGQASPAPTVEPTLAIPPTVETLLTEATCPNIVEAALATIDSACDDTGRNEACYGNVRLDVVPQPDAGPVSFAQQGDKVNLADVQSLTLSSMDEAAREWGMAVMKVQADLPDALPGQNVTFLLFGDVQIQNDVAAGDSRSPMQAFRIETGLRDSVCSNAPDSGMLIQTPEGIGQVRFTVNSVDVTLSSTAYIQAEAGESMAVNMLEGEAEVTAQGVTQTVSAGEQVSVPMDADLQASGPPADPQPYNLPTLAVLPVTHLERTIEVAPNASPLTSGTVIEIANEGTVSASTTYNDNFEASLSIDGDRSTSWFSAGPGSDGTSVYRWTGTKDDTIAKIALLSNAENSTPDFRTGFGFGSVTVQVLDADGSVVFEQTVALDGTPDPDVAVSPGVIGRSIVLTFSGHEDATCGGFSELEIQALRSSDE